MSGPHRSFDDLVDALTPRVVDEAAEEAVRRAREELAGHLARAIVERALAATDPVPAGHAATDRPVGAPAPAPAAAPDPDSTALYAFAIIPARPVDLAGVTGIDGEAPLRIVLHHELGLVVSEMRLGLMDDVSEDDLSETGALATLARRHDEAVRSVFEHGPVLPLRFGTVVADENGARRLLEEQSSSARRRLAHLDTHREWGVRLSREETVTGPDATDDGDGERARRREMTGTSYLASRRQALQESQRAEQQTAALTARVEEELSGHAVDLAHRGGGPGSGLLADLAYLVPAGSEQPFLAAAERLKDEVAREGLVLSVTGPWPPYSFAGPPSDRAGVVGSA
ncbi:MAG: GvpL/GvpF family gas vesicle protein [Actinomycetota bacterium]|nr:GvpL/GvpF family gas vesicle protein [Actinomycetota bacterium]